MDTQDMHDQLAEIREAGSRCKHLQAEYLIAKEVTSDAKKEWESACARLQELSCRWQDSEEVAARPLIAAVEAKAEELESANGFDLVTSGLTKPGRKRRVATENPT